MSGEALSEVYGELMFSAGIIRTDIYQLVLEVDELLLLPEMLNYPVYYYSWCIYLLPGCSEELSVHI